MVDAQKANVDHPIRCTDETDISCWMKPSLVLTNKIQSLPASKKMCNLNVQAGTTGEFSNPSGQPIRVSLIG